MPPEQWDTELEILNGKVTPKESKDTIDVYKYKDKYYAIDKNGDKLNDFAKDIVIGGTLVDRMRRGKDNTKTLNVDSSTINVYTPNKPTPGQIGSIDKNGFQSVITGKPYREDNVANTLEMHLSNTDKSLDTVSREGYIDLKKKIPQLDKVLDDIYRNTPSDKRQYIQNALTLLPLVKLDFLNGVLGPENKAKLLQKVMEVLINPSETNIDKFLQEEENPDMSEALKNAKRLTIAYRKAQEANGIFNYQILDSRALIQADPKDTSDPLYQINIPSSKSELQRRVWDRTLLELKKGSLLSTLNSQASSTDPEWEKYLYAMRYIHP